MANFTSIIISHLDVCFCLGDISADDDDPKAALASSPIMQGEPVSIEEAPGETWNRFVQV